jgi:hypothetical protein
MEGGKCSCSCSSFLAPHPSAIASANAAGIGGNKAPGGVLVNEDNKYPLLIWKLTEKIREKAKIVKRAHH